MTLPPLPGPQNSARDALAATCARLPQLHRRLQATAVRPEHDDWFLRNRFFDQPGFGDLRQKMEKRYATRSRPAIAAKLLSRYQWGILVTAIGCYLRDGRVPHLRADDLMLRWNSPGVYVDAVAYTSGRFTALSDDPAAGLPGVYAVGSRHALRNQLRLEIESHFAEFIAEICLRIPINPRALWPTVADRCAETILWLGPEAARIGAFSGSLEYEVDALVNVAGSPLHNKATGVLPVTCAGQTHLFLKRAACCHAYRRQGREICDTCPHFTLEERAKRLCAHITQP